MQNLITRIVFWLIAPTYLACAGVAGAAPVIFWSNDPVGPNDSVMMIGSALAHASVTLWGAQDHGHLPRSVPTTSTARSISFVVPSDLKPGVYHYVVKTDDGVTKGLINAPKVYWIQSDRGEKATVGGWLRIFGRNISISNNAHVTLTSPGLAPLVIKASKPSLWDATFFLPRRASPGLYSVLLDNGSGELDDKSEAGAIRISPPPLKPEYLVNVREFGAVGDGKSNDDTPAIRKAVQRAMEVGGGAVYFPRGYYHLDGTLVLPDGVTFKGERRDLVHLVWRDTPSPPPALVVAGSDTTIEDLTIVASQHLNIISAGFGGSAADPDGKNITIRRVTIRASAFWGHLSPDESSKRLTAMLGSSNIVSDSLRVAGRNIVVEDCDIYGSGRSLYLYRPSNARITNNIFENGRLGWYSITGADGVIFTNNTIRGADIQATGGGINTLGRGVNASRNVFMAFNFFGHILGWDGEAVTSDGSGGFYFGHARSTSDKAINIVDRDAAHNLLTSVGAAVFVISGSGAGEYGRVADVKDNLVILDRSLQVALDNSSIVSVTPYQANYLIVNNDFADTRPAVQLYGTSIDMVIADNKMTRTDGIADLGLADYGGAQPSWHTQILHNTIAEGGLSSPALIILRGLQTETRKVSLNLGAVVRGNRLEGNSSIVVTGGTADRPSVSDTIIEGNTIVNCNHPISVLGATEEILIRNNSCH